MLAAYLSTIPAHSPSTSLQLYDLFTMFPRPAAVQCDDGSEFRAAVTSLCELLGIRVINSSPGNPQTNGVVERGNFTLRDMVRAMLMECKPGAPVGRCAGQLALCSLLRQPRLASVIAACSHNVLPPHAAALQLYRIKDQINQKPCEVYGNQMSRYEALFGVPPLRTVHPPPEMLANLLQMSRCADAGLVPARWCALQCSAGLLLSASCRRRGACETTFHWYQPTCVLPSLYCLQLGHRGGPG